MEENVLYQPEEIKEDMSSLYKNLNNNNYYEIDDNHQKIGS